MKLCLILYFTIIISHYHRVFERVVLFSYILSSPLKMCTTDWNAPPGPSGTDFVVVVVVAFGYIYSLPVICHFIFEHSHLNLQ